LGGCHLFDSPERSWQTAGGPPPGGRRLRPLDGLRGLAALVVVVHHAVQVAPATTQALDGPVQVGSLSWWWTYTPLRLTWAGNEAVLVFFVLSGFVLALPALTHSLRLAPYYAKRLLRLYLPVWGSLTVAALLVVLVPRQLTGSESAYVSHRAQASLADLPREAALLLEGERLLNGPLWSLRWEVLFSLLLPVYLLLARRFSAHRTLSWMAVFCVLGVGQVTSSPYAIYLPVFALGVLLAYHQADMQEAALRLNRTSRPRLAWALLAVLTVVLLTARWTYDGLPVVHPVLDAGTSAAPFVGACLALFLALHWPAGSRHLQAPVWQWLGTCSFSLYLIHEPVIITVALLVPSGAAWLAVVLGAALSVPAGQLFYRWVEQPSMRAANRAGTATARARAV
jgi:peptidoglycan/LPS O-acetylase OafA/YrhL